MVSVLDDQGDVPGSSIEHGSRYSGESRRVVEGASESQYRGGGAGFEQQHRPTSGRAGRSDEFAGRDGDVTGQLAGRLGAGVAVPPPPVPPPPVPPLAGLLNPAGIAVNAAAAARVLSRGADCAVVAQPVSSAAVVAKTAIALTVLRT